MSGVWGRQARPSGLLPTRVWAASCWLGCVHCTQLLHRAGLQPTSPKCALGAACGAAAGHSGGDGGKERLCSPSFAALQAAEQPCAHPEPGTHSLIPSPAPERCVTLICNQPCHVFSLLSFSSHYTEVLSIEKSFPNWEGLRLSVSKCVLKT